MKGISNKAALNFLMPSLIFFLAWFFVYYLNKPLVWDEIVSLINFVLVDFTTTVTHYPDVNNHIFFNLVNNAYCKMLGIKDLYQAMDTVPVMRILTLFISLGTMTYTYAVGHRFMTPWIGTLAVMILVTTMPFLNFTAQFRGYTLSTFFFIGAIYHLWSFETNTNKIHGIFSLIYVTALLYTIPSNVFLALSIGLIFFFKWFVFSRAKQKSGLDFAKAYIENRFFIILLLVGLGAILSYLLYLPILEDLLNERHLQQTKGKSFYEYNLKDLIPNVLWSLLSFKYLLVIPVLLGLWKLIGILKRHKWTDQSVYRIVSLLALFLFPFLISLIRGDKTPQRSFVPLATVFSLLLAVSVFYFFKGIKFTRNRMSIAAAITFVYCLVSYQLSRNNVNDVLHKAMLNGKKLNTMMYNFYQSDEYDLHELDKLIEDAKKTRYPIIMAKEIDRVCEGEYLQKHDLLYYATVWAKQSPANNKAGFEYQVLFEIANGKGSKPSYDRIGFPPSITERSGKAIPIYYYLLQKKLINPQDPKYYVLTFDSRWFEEAMRSNLPDMKFSRMNKKLNYHNIYIVSRKEPVNR